MLLTIKYKKGNRVWIGRAADREKKRGYVHFQLITKRAHTGQKACNQ